MRDGIGLTSNSLKHIYWNIVDVHESQIEWKLKLDSKVIVKFIETIIPYSCPYSSAVWTLFVRSVKKLVCEARNAITVSMNVTITSPSNVSFHLICD